MIRPFRLRDSYLLQKLARQSVPLHLERHLIQPRQPLGMALSAPVAWRGSGAATFISHHSQGDNQPSGFIQASKHLGRPEADVRYIAPRLENNTRAADTWRELLRFISISAADFGLHRLYACVPAQEPAAEIIASSGFAIYVRETLFRLDSITEVGDDDAGLVRDQREVDSFALQRLFDRYTPPVVQKAEGAFVREGDSASYHLIFQNWWQPDRVDGLVYEQDGQILGAVRIRRGSKGHWLRFVGDVSRQDVMAALLRGAMRRMQRDSRPIYCGVRPYQNALGAVLHDGGFTSGPELARFVRYTAVHAREPATSKKRILIEPTIPGVISSEPIPKT